MFDAATRPLLRAEEYEMPGVSELKADSLEELAALMEIPAEEFVRTVEEFNAATNDAELDPTVKDGKASAVTPPKSNWASPIAEGPYYAYPVTCGITFTSAG